MLSIYEEMWHESAHPPIMPSIEEVNAIFQNLVSKLYRPSNAFDSESEITTQYSPSNSVDINRMCHNINTADWMEWNRVNYRFSQHHVYCLNIKSACVHMPFVSRIEFKCAMFLCLSEERTEQWDKVSSFFFRLLLSRVRSRCPIRVLPNII